MTSMMDLAGALGGGAPPAPAPEEETPPEEGGSSIDYLDDAEEALQAFIQVDPDEVDRAKASQALKIVLDLKAANQQSAEAGDMKSLRRALGGAPAGPPLAPGGPPLA